MKNKINPLAQGILNGLHEAVAHAKGNPTAGTRETVIYSADSRAIREKLNMSQSEFAKAYKIPLSTLKNWEQGRRRPDATASAYLWSIDRYPQEIKAGHQNESVEYGQADCAI